MNTAGRTRPGPDQVALRSVVGVGTAVVLVAATGAGAAVPLWQAVTLLGLAALTACWPDSSAGTLLLVGSAYVWAGTPESLSPWVLVAAAGMVYAHLAAQMAAVGPAQLAVDSAQVSRWAVRAALVWIAAAVTWVMVVWMRELPAGRTVYALGLLLLTVVAVAAAHRISTSRDRADQTARSRASQY
jgi:hypothetical protein